MSAKISTHRTLLAVVVVGSLTAIAGCGSGDDSDSATSTPTMEQASEAPSEPDAGNPPPSSAPAATATTAPPTPTTAAPTTTAPPTATTTTTTVPVPKPVRDMMALTAGWTYASSKFSVPFEFSIPEDATLGRWTTLFDTSDYLILTLKMAEKESPEVKREEPGVSFHALPDDVGIDDFVSLWAAFGEGHEHFTAETSDGVYLGTPSVVVSGTYDIGEVGDGAYSVRLTDSMRMFMAPGERRYVSYLVPVEDAVVLVRINAHELDFDLAVTLAGQIVDTIEFVSP